MSGGAEVAELFLELWEKAEAATATQRAAATQTSTAFDAVCGGALNNDDATAGAATIKMIVEGRATDPTAQRLGRLLAAMQVIDSAFATIHPRFLLNDQAIAAARPPEWLRDLRGRRRISGDYARRGGRRLLARGPLLRSARRPDASSGEFIADRFVCLAVAPMVLEHDGRAIDVQMEPVVDRDWGVGVEDPAEPGGEQVAFVPIAVRRGDMLAETNVHGGRNFARYRPAPGLDPARKALDALAALGAADIVLMPELVFSEETADQLAAGLNEAGCDARLVVAGTYETTQRRGAFPWNECRVLNGRGAELWRQRKIWTAGISPLDMPKYGLPTLEGSDLVLEETECGDMVAVVDIDTLGRCVVLICQDLETPRLAGDLALLYQPDWILTPILDPSGFDPGRWAHSRAYGLSSMSQARFAAVTSLAFAPAYDPERPFGMGMAMGPKQPAGSAGETLQDEARAFRLVPRRGPDEPEWSIIRWRDGGWSTTSLKVE